MRHVRGAKKKGAVSEIDVPEGASIDWARAMAEEFCAQAQSDARGCGGVQQYVLHGYDAEDTQKFKLTVRVADDSPDDSDDGVLTEAPNRVGLTSQLMRHTEVMHRQSTMSMTAILQAQNKTIETQAKTIAELSAKRTQVFELYEEAMSQKHVRDIETMRENTKNESIKQLAGGLKMLLPVVGNKLMGAQMSVGTDIKGVLSGFFETITPDQFAQLTSMLRPEQQATLMSVVEALQKSEEKGSPEVAAVTEN